MLSHAYPRICANCICFALNEINGMHTLAIEFTSSLDAIIEPSFKGCSHGVIATVNLFYVLTATTTLNPMQPISCDK